MKIALAAPPIPESINDGLYWLDKLSREAAEQGGEIICFPESFLPGYPTGEYEVEKSTPGNMWAALDNARDIAAKYKIAIILPMDHFEGEVFLNVAFVISAEGKVLGYQSKNQLDPSEDNIWNVGTERSIFEVNGVKFGITICHEGFRYPESTRWAARNDAAIVFHPNCTGSNKSGNKPTEWGDKNSPYYEKATMLRAMENTIFFASVNYCFEYPDSASCVVGPDGKCLGYQPYGVPGVVVVDIDMEQATGVLAKRFRTGIWGD